MRSLFNFLFKRSIAAVITLFLLTVILYGVIALAPLEMRLLLYIPENISPRFLDDPILWQQIRNQIIQKNHLNDPFPVQYLIWLKSLAVDRGGYSIILKQPTLDAIQKRLPATLELAFYSMLLLIPLSLGTGILAASQAHRPVDRLVRSFSTMSTSIPTFILAFFLLAVFYVGLGWFAPGRLSQNLSLELRTLPNFRYYTGFLTLDGLLNLRPDITLDALGHLVLPVVTLSLSFWALLTRLVRNAMLEELKKDYITAAQAKGLPPRLIFWRHALRNILPTFLTNTALTAAAIVSGVFVIERIYLWPGISSIIMRNDGFQPDPPAVLGFIIYSVIMVLGIMLILDVLHALVNPRFSLKGESD